MFLDWEERFDFKKHEEYVLFTVLYADPDEIVPSFLGKKEDDYRWEEPKGKILWEDVVACSSDLGTELKDYQDRKFYPTGDGFLREDKERARRIVEALLKGIILDLKKSLKEAKSPNDIINSAATFGWKYINIHPFPNANGRTVRILIEKILMDYGMPPPIMYPWGQDVEVTIEQFASFIKDSTIVSKRFHQDLKTLMARDIPYSYVTSHIFTPGFYKRLKVKSKDWQSLMNFRPKDLISFLVQKRFKVEKFNHSKKYRVFSLQKFRAFKKMEKKNRWILNIFHRNLGLPPRFRD